MFVTPKSRDRVRDVMDRIFCRRDADPYVGLRSAEPECYWFSRTARVYASILLVLADLLGAATVLEMVVHRTAVAIPAVVFATLGWATIFALSNHKAGRSILTSRDIIKLARIDAGLCVVILALTVVLTKAVLGAATSHLMLLSLSSGCLILMLSRLVVLVVSAQWRPRVMQHVLLVGTATAVARQLRNPPLGGAHVGYAGAILIGEGSVSLPIMARINARTGEIMTPGQDAPGSGALEHGRQSRRLLRRIDRIVLLEDGLEPGEKRGALQWLERFSHEVHVLTAPPPQAIGEAIAYERCVLARPASIQPMGLNLKRSLDILLSLAALIILLPALLIVAVLVKLESKGPVLFRQPRLGCDNLPFTVLKFRTMRQNDAADGSVQAVRGDARITRFGAILRTTSIDELPQLLNVLNGSMSLVGPRPHPVALNCRFEPFIARYAARHSVLPGITGWAQINGARGETPTVEAMQRRVELDLEYVQRQSILLDLWIMVRTVGSVLRARNVY